jgi:ribosome biogenesis GTPase / thiamine phosphate phosphatase
LINKFKRKFKFAKNKLKYKIKIDSGLKKGVVVKSTGSWYLVKDENNNFFSCKIKGKYRIQGIRATNPVAVGDRVNYSLNQNENTGLITHIEERKNYIIRRSSNLSKEYQLIAANVDQAWLLVSLISPKTFPEFIDRFLVSAEAYSIPTNIIFNKIDLYGEEENKDLKKFTDTYEKIGYHCYSISAAEQTNIKPVKEAMKDKINVISGNSGVGKSTLINILDSNLQLKTSEISNANKSGKHTTTYAEMFEFEFGGFIIDTPGIKGFGLIDFGKDELFHYFPEIFEASSGCKFHNCSHIHEPGCEVIKSVMEGKISETRYLSYLNILEGDDERYR